MSKEGRKAGKDVRKGRKGMEEGRKEGIHHTKEQRDIMMGDLEVECVD